MISNNLIKLIDRNRLSKAYDLTIQFYRKLYTKYTKIKLNDMPLLWCMGLKFCVKFHWKVPFEISQKCWTHLPQNMHFSRC